MILTAREAGLGDHGDYLTLSMADDALTYDLPEGTDWLVSQLTVQTPAGSWTASAIVTAEISLDGNTFAAFPSAAITYTSVGIKEILTVTGAVAFRLRVSTAQAGSNLIWVLVTAGSDST